MEAILDDELSSIDAFLGAGHVCAIMGFEAYYPLTNKYKIPIVITGFEPLDLVHGIYMAVNQLEKGIYKVENQYARVVKEEGNKAAIDVINKVFEIGNREWRGIGEIPNSGYKLKNEFKEFDAELKFGIINIKVPENSDCIAGEILKGIKKPHQCSQFGKTCTPINPLGAPMVSSEGACAAYYHFSDNLINHN
jgi:hydrogenase expression/formation protein HypD